MAYPITVPAPNPQRGIVTFAGQDSIAVTLSPAFADEPIAYVRAAGALSRQPLAVPASYAAASHPGLASYITSTG